MTGKSFQSADSVWDAWGAEVGVEVRVGAGVIGEYFLGFCVVVGKDATASAGNICVGAPTGMLMEVGFVSPVQAVIKKQTNKIRINRRFIAFKYSGGKLIIDEILCYTRSMAYQGLLHKYGTLLDLPLYTSASAVSLLEGNTPLIKADNLARQLGGEFELFIKYEGLNPTGSFKDRGMTAAVSEALGRGATTVICASTGNTAASAAAYAARAGMKSIVLIPQGKVAAGKLAGAIAYGAQVIQIDGSFDDALTMVIEITNKHPICLVNSINPYRIEGQKTSAFEICDVLDSAPDWLCLPVGNAGNITSYWAGFKQYNQMKSTGLPQVLGVQAAGSAPLVLGHPIENPETVATAIRIGKPARGEQALQAAEESKGRIIAATDDQILEMQKTLARLEGIWVEPASAAGLAGLAIEIANGTLNPKGKRVVAICTGHGLKDPEIITKDMQKPSIVPPKLEALEEVILA
jgi:threonine synthase